MERSKFYVEEVLAHYDFCLQRQRPFGIIDASYFFRGNRAWFWPSWMWKGQPYPLSGPLFFPRPDFECRNIAIFLVRRLDAWLWFLGRHLWRGFKLLDQRLDVVFRKDVFEKIIHIACCFQLGSPANPGRARASIRARVRLLRQAVSAAPVSAFSVRSSRPALLEIEVRHRSQDVPSHFAQEPFKIIKIAESSCSFTIRDAQSRKLLRWSFQFLTLLVQPFASFFQHEH